MKSIDDFSPEVLLGNIWHNYKLCRSTYSEQDLKFRLFSEFRVEITERYNFLHETEYKILDLAQMIVGTASIVDSELYVYRTIFARSGIDVSEVGEILGDKKFLSLWDMKTYDVFDCIFIDRSSYVSFIDSLTKFIFD